jgi:hypothetical protein
MNTHENDTQAELAAWEILAETREKLDRAMEIVKAVAHIGIDWGYGEYQLSAQDIDKARKLYEGKPQ